jgi:G6PDH family F420-dependent oxidoreductase
MMRIGYALASEQYSPGQLLEQARRAHKAGFASFSISDHFHPWNEAQGNSPFVWSMIGAVSQAAPGLPVSTMVTCPIIRIHPVILAQAAATSAVLLEGRFIFGVGTGENLNEHVSGTPWPPESERLERLEEAIELIRLLWKGDNVNFDGRYYRAVNARVYTLPNRPPPVYVSGLGLRASKLAADIGDGFVTTSPQPIELYRQAGGKGPIQSAVKACFDDDEDRAVDLVHELWGMELNPGGVNRELALPSNIESVASLVTKEKVAERFPCGPDPKRHIEEIEKLADAGCDEIFVQQVGDDMDGFFELYSSKVLAHFKS